MKEYIFCRIYGAALKMGMVEVKGNIAPNMILLIEKSLGDFI